jgi:hypothetical protein
MDPRIVLRNRDETISYINEPVPEIPRGRKPAIGHRKTVLGPDAPRAVVFITYSGYKFGPKEAEPAVQLLALEIEHTGFLFVGKFCYNKCSSLQKDKLPDRRYIVSQLAD